jgi:hypothetical protein
MMNKWIVKILVDRVNRWWVDKCNNLINIVLCLNKLW